VRRLAGDLDAADEAAARALSIDASYLPARVTTAYDRLARGDVTSARRELDAVVARGGGALGGVARARKCAALDPAGARECAMGAPLVESRRGAKPSPDPER
jgi:hypothetical protein